MASDWFPFPRLATGSDWLVGGGVRSGDFQRLLDSQKLFPWNLTKWSFSVNKMEELRSFIMNQNLILNYYFYIKFIYIIKYTSITSSGVEF